MSLTLPMTQSSWTDGESDLGRERRLCHRSGTHRHELASLASTCSQVSGLSRSSSAWRMTTDIRVATRWPRRVDADPDDAIHYSWALGSSTELGHGALQLAGP
mmetsp:Transcript_29245/g.97100  ORF Transcript_29245/g.97100 Transcript_29245/m.97100 type:complete len:103 (+) Transcript_29245:2331-2639(+)